MTKVQKLAYLYTLLEKVFPDTKPLDPQDLSKVYETKKELSSTWGEILDVMLPIKLLSSMKYPPLFWWGNTFRVNSIDIYKVWLTTPPQFSSILDDYDCNVIRGSDALALLDQLRAELGPDPEKELILSTSEGYKIVKLREFTHAELDEHIEELQYTIKERENRCKKEQQGRRGEQDNENKLKKLVENMGYDEVFKRLLENDD